MFPIPSRACLFKITTLGISKFIIRGSQILFHFNVTNNPIHPPNGFVVHTAYEISRWPVVEVRTSCTTLLSQPMIAHQKIWVVIPYGISFCALLAWLVLKIPHHGGILCAGDNYNSELFVPVKVGVYLGWAFSLLFKSSFTLTGTNKLEKLPSLQVDALNSLGRWYCWKKWAHILSAELEKKIRSKKCVFILNVFLQPIQVSDLNR